MTPELSIIIITLNKEKYLQFLLESIKKQSYKDYEIIVADYNSIDKTRKMAKQYKCKIIKGGGYSRGRNNGAKIARGAFLLFLDADCILPKDFLKKNLKIFKDSNSGVGTTEVLPISNRFVDKFFYKIYDFWSRLMSCFSPHCCGGSIFAVKLVFDIERGFDEKIVFAENQEFSKRLGKRYGFIILPIPIYTSVRRLDYDGRIRFFIKYLYAGLYRLFYKEINNERFEYRRG